MLVFTPFIVPDIDSNSPLRVCLLCQKTSQLPYCPADGMATILAESPPSRPQNLKIGTVLGGRYRVESVIGHGGFGTVFEAIHVGTGQRVAIKALETSGEANELEIRRFFQEARITAQLQHPNTVRVFDFGQGDDGLIYLVMELLRGQSLRQFINQRRRDGELINQAEALEMGVQMASSLVEAHLASLVHRDLKPDNVFIQEVSSSQKMVKVLDFGIAKVQNASLTKGKGTFGTPHYMSPEQAMGSDLDGRSDIYALGVILYELVTGQHPYSGDTPVSILYQHVHSAVPQVAKDTRVPLQSDFVAVVDRCLHKEPGDRFENAQALCDALIRCSTEDFDLRSNPGLLLASSGGQLGLGAQGQPSGIPSELGDFRPEIRVRRPITTDTISSSAEISPLHEPTGPQVTAQASMQRIGLAIVIAIILALWGFWSWDKELKAGLELSPAPIAAPAIGPKPKKATEQNENKVESNDGVESAGKAPSRVLKKSSKPGVPKPEPLVKPGEFKPRILPEKTAPKSKIIIRSKSASAKPRVKSKSTKKSGKSKKAKSSSKTNSEKPTLDTWVD